MTIYEHVLEGCAPVPLAGYLKGLGVFRLVAEQADPTAEGFWRDERFVLRTQLTQDGLVRFFVDDYRPTPVVAPWNGGSGFWPGDNRDGIEKILTSDTDRLAIYRQTIDLCENTVCLHGMKEAPKDASKAKLIAKLRADISDSACRWLDGALALTAEGPLYPPLLGTGGNDGRLDFSNNFMRRLTDVIEGNVNNSEELVLAALFAEPSRLLEKGAVGQFSPGAAGGVNAGTGFEADSRINPWDFVLTIEGALLFAAAAVRRFAEDRSASLAFPFTTRAVGAGSGAAALADEEDARAEFWAPLWSRPARLSELLQLMSEGRAVLNGKGARDSLDFARATAQLGIARGIDTFCRHAFLMRAGKAYFATPLGRVQVWDNGAASLISDLDEHGWLRRVRGAMRTSAAPGTLIRLGRRLDDALFRLSAIGSRNAVQDALIAIGELMLEAARRPKLRQTDKGFPPLPPCPLLSSEWVEAANDGSHEFALAEALASLDANAEGFRMPFRRHLAPLAWPKGRDDWGDTTEATTLVVWTGRDLVSDMIDLLQRRLMEAHRHIFVDRDGRDELPLRGWRTAPLSAVCAFLTGTTDDTRTSSLAAGLAWARSRGGEFTTTPREQEIPFAYAALKPVFVARATNAAPDERRIMNPLPLVRLIRAGRIADAIAKAQKMAWISGFATPFLQVTAAKPSDSRRMLAALAFPLAPKAELSLRSRAYPVDTKEEEVSHAA